MLLENFVGQAKFSSFMSFWQKFLNDFIAPVPELWWNSLYKGILASNVQNMQIPYLPIWDIL